MSAAEVNALDADVIHDLCANSIFKNIEDNSISEYFTIDDANLEIQKTQEGILLIHINAVSLVTNFTKIKDMLAKLKPNPSIIFITETRVKDSKLQQQLNKIRMEGYHDMTLSMTTPKVMQVVQLSMYKQYS